jgi:sialate O-acetylesterase
MNNRPLLAIAILLLLAAPTLADVTVAPIFGSHMVLQRDRQQRIWGEDAAGTAITVTIAGQTQTAKTGDDGKWNVTLQPIAAGGPHELTVTGSSTVTLTDILIGELWLASGQSNMNVALGNTRDGEKEIAAANYPQIRYFRVKQEASRDPVRTSGRWVAVDPTTAKPISGVAYFFARELHKELNVPIGIVHAGWAGTVIEAWTPLEGLNQHPTFKTMLADWDKKVEQDPAKVAAAQEEQRRWQAQADEAKKAGAAPPPRPPQVIAPNNPNTPGILYSSLIRPLTALSIRGVIWYQGESNVGNSRIYPELLDLMLAQWRDAFGQKELPFLIVQLPNFDDDARTTNWAAIREGQRRALRFPGTGLVTTIDVGDSKDLHPKNKEPVGHRLALVALSQVYGKDVVASGPLFKDATPAGDKLVVHFDHVHGGLTTTDGQPPRCFEVAGPDGNWQPADAKIDGQTIVLTSTAVKSPASVRYAYSNDPKVNLTNKEGLPAVPFTQDAPK